MSLELNTVLGIPKTVNTFYVSLRVPPPNGLPRQTGSPAKGYPAYPKLNVIPAGRSAGGVEEPACFDEPPDIDSEPARSY